MLLVKIYSIISIKTINMENKWVTSSINHDNILWKFTNNTWLLDKIFWKEGIILYNEEKEKIKRILFEVYWLKDIYDIFDPELDEEKIDRTLKTIFRFNDLKLPDNIDEPSIFE